MEDTNNTTILIKVNDDVIGAAQTTTIVFNRDIIPIKGDNGGIIDIIAGDTTVAGKCGYVMFHKNKIEKTFNSQSISKNTQKMPFDMEILYKAIEKTYVVRNVWITSKHMQLSYVADSHIIVMPGMEWEAEAILPKDHNELTGCTIGNKINGG